MRHVAVIVALGALALAGCGDEPDNVTVPQASTPAGAQTTGVTTPGGKAQPGTANGARTTPDGTAAAGANGQPAPAGTATKANFIASADVICKDYNHHAVRILK